VVRADELASRFVRDEADPAGNQGPEIVVHDVEVETLQVRDVARNVEREDLPLAARQQLVAASQAFEDQAALRRAVLIPNDVVVLADVPDGHRQRDDRLPLFVRDGRDAFELHDQGL
jgi:hypothetical protein